MSLDLAAIRARLDAATPGPWHLETDSCDCGDGYGCPHGTFPHALRLPVHTPGSRDRECDKADSLDRYRHLASEFCELTMETAQFIAGAREDVAVLLAEVERLRTVAWQFHGAMVGQHEMVGHILNDDCEPCQRAADEMDSRYCCDDWQRRQKAYADALALVIGGKP